ncbi:MAG: hypothetical protein IJX99_09980 [Clostridia bacterium]|nr:hypothetical protein [Clostridia bacterium]
MNKERCELCNRILNPEIALGGADFARFGQICRKCLEDLRSRDEYAYDEHGHMLTPEKNNFSFWFPKVEHCGLKVPKSLIFNVPEEIQNRFFLEGEDDYEVIDNWLKVSVLPALKEADMHLLFVKNATFSNKFLATSCMATQHTLLDAITSINYGALMVGAEGLSEFVVRERIMHNSQSTPCIYHGLPLRSEFRVFYDFTKHKVIFIENYWNYGYVFPNLHDATDKIVFEHERERLEREFDSRKQEVSELVASAMQNVEGFEGPWSVDIMLEGNTYYLIDMALAETSAYWTNRPGYERVHARELEVRNRRRQQLRPAAVTKLDPAIVELLE